MTTIRAKSIVDGRFFMYFTPVTTECAPRRFLETLHHRALSTGRGLIYLQTELSGTGNCSARNLDEALDFVQKNSKDTYVCVNTMRRPGSRSTQNCYAVTGFYVDLDKHDGSPEEIEAVKQRTRERLEGCFTDGTLPVPTLITHTRRGYGLFYVLRNTIAHTDGAKSLLEMHRYVYRWILRAYEKALEGDGYMTVDMKVMDKPRICRVPGTTVGETQFTVGLSDYEPRLYSITELRKGFGIKERDQSQARLREYAKMLGAFLRRPHKTIQFNQASTVSFLEHRLDVFAEIAEILAERGDMEGHRELLLFCIHNHLRKLLPYDEACAELRRLNRDLIGGAIGDGEINNLIRSKRVYRMSNKYLIDIFDLSQEEATRAGIGSITKHERREAAKACTKGKKERQIALVKQYKPQIKRRDKLLEEINAQLRKEGYKTISARTLDRRIKEAGLHKEGTLPLTQTAEYRKQLFVREEKSTENKKLPKIAPISISPSKGEPVKAPSEGYSFDPELIEYERRYEFLQGLQRQSVIGWADGLLGLYEAVGGEPYDLVPFTGGALLLRSQDAGCMSETEAATVKRFVRQLWQENRTRAYALLRRFAAAVSPEGTVSFTELDAVVRRMYRKPLGEVRILPWRASPAQKDAFRRRLRNQELWDWVLVATTKTVKERTVASVYHRLNNRCRDAINDGRGADACGYGGLSFAEFKKKVLYSLAVEDLQRIAGRLIAADESLIAAEFVAAWKASAVA